ncbi:hypothetical protein CC2G_013881 [Coprinopsis cinerea AmutBmut pab1-1]|nr:hypothetical protein CC2G_013881 [Coprinopsis cinerea AmutBmut pab1-1]
MSAILPPEIWGHIFSLACRDGGQTGRSLSLVSRDFHSYSARVKYQSITLTTSREILRFSTLLPRLQEHQRRVKFLFVHCPNIYLDVPEDEDDEDYVQSPQNSMSASSSSSSTDSMESTRSTNVMELDDSDDSPEAIDNDEYRELIQEADTFLNNSDDVEMAEDNDTHTSQFHEEMIAADEIVTDALHSILSANASTLEILSIRWTSFHPRLMDQLFPQLPVLKELCLLRSFSADEAIEPASNDPMPPLFPSLRRFHIGGYVEQRSLSFSQSLATLTPNLEYLRIPHYFFLHDGNEDEEPPLSKVSLKRLILELPAHDPTADIPTSAIWSHNSLRLHLFGQGHSSPKIATKVELISGTAVNDDVDTWAGQWLDRISGGEGCWNRVHDQTGLEFSPGP